MRTRVDYGDPSIKVRTNQFTLSLHLLVVMDPFNEENDASQSETCTGNVASKLMQKLVKN